MYFNDDRRLHFEEKLLRMSKEIGIIEMKSVLLFIYIYLYCSPLLKFLSFAQRK